MIDDIFEFCDLCGTNEHQGRKLGDMQFFMTAGQHAELRRIQMVQATMAAVATRRTDDRGEGVISMAIAVLIVAFLGVALWLAFKGFADDTERTLDEQVDKIGN